MTDPGKGVYDRGIFRKGDVRISDLSGNKRLPVGNSNFTTCVENSVFIDKSLFIADIIDGGATAMLYCRPRRFGKSLNLDMLQRFFEVPSPSDPSGIDTTHLFEGLAIWDAKSGAYRIHHQAYPVVRLSFSAVKERAWEDALALVSATVAAEYSRHGYLAESPRLSLAERETFMRIVDGRGDGADAKRSLAILTRLLYVHHGRRAVVLIDEYDVPVMAGYTYRYYDEAVTFMKAWLVGALKDNDALAFSVLTGVQRISKESVFSDLNNLLVNTSLDTVSDERYGFMQDEVDALANYLGFASSTEELRAWYDGYRFGTVDVYNPWSVLNYFFNGCAVDVYWGNTSSNAVLGELVEGADESTLEMFFQLLEPGGSIEAPLDLRVVLPDVGVREGAVWSMLYLAGYLTTADTAMPNDVDRTRVLSVPNFEIAKLFRSEIIQRYASIAGSRDRLGKLQRAFVCGDAEAVQEELERILVACASSFDLTRENSYHMLVLGLLFGMPGYRDPLSNREAGRGRFDVLVRPENADQRPYVVVELKHAAGSCSEEALASLADEALRQIEDREYARAYDAGDAGSVCFGIAACGKRIAVKTNRNNG